MRIALTTLDTGRIGIAAQAVGIAQAALDLAAGYARERSAFGGPIARLGAIQHKLAEMQTEIEAARLKQAGRPHTVEGAQAKLFASRVARQWTGEAIQVLGGYGYTKEVPAERYYRDAKVTEIYEGMSEVYGFQKEGSFVVMAVGMHHRCMTSLPSLLNADLARERSRLSGRRAVRRRLVRPTVRRED